MAAESACLLRGVFLGLRMGVTNGRGWRYSIVLGLGYNNNRTSGQRLAAPLASNFGFGVSSVGRLQVPMPRRYNRGYGDI